MVDNILHSIISAYSAWQVHIDANESQLPVQYDLSKNSDYHSINSNRN